MRIALLTGLALCCTAPAFAQDAGAVARTPDGRPDLQGVWATRFITRLERLDDAAALEVSAKEAREVAGRILADQNASLVTDPDFAFYGFDQLAVVNGRYRTSLIVDPVDGRIPFTPAGSAVADRFSDLESFGFDHPEERPDYERCLGGIIDAPIRVLPMLIPLQIVQTPDAVVITNEDVHGVRIVPVGETSSASSVRATHGAGLGRWDGDTLVIETSGFRATDIARPDFGPPIVLSEKTRIIERFTRTSPNELHYAYTVEDADLYTQPWRAEYAFTLEAGGAVHEYACHEANYSMTNMLTAARLGRQSQRSAGE